MCRRSQSVLEVLLLEVGPVRTHLELGPRGSPDLGKVHRPRVVAGAGYYLRLSDLADSEVVVFSGAE